MPISKETVEEILDFAPKNHTGEFGLDLGEVVEGTTLFYDVFAYGRRVVGVPGEPFTGDLTRQRVLGLVSRDKKGNVTGRFPLAYAADVLAIGDLAEQVLDKITVLQERSRAAV